MPRKPGTAPAPSPGKTQTRVGIGYDSHRFDSSRPLILGGVKIAGFPGLLGHSDGDAVCHALTDAVLGAAGAGDIGGMFPDDSEANLDRDSLEMLTLAVARIRDAGYRVAQVDIVVVTEAPKIGPHRQAIQEKISGALGVSAADVSVKGKSNEGMGWIGREEGLACMAVATLARDDG
jgi:2-C-methyl-D-erythritol 2,4-cyclodiphosphate synthase